MLAVDFGAGAHVISSTEPIDMERSLHVVEFGHVGRKVFLWTDGQVNVSSEAPGLLSELNVHSSVYLGGTDLPGMPHSIPCSQQFVGE